MASDYPCDIFQSFLIFLESFWSLSYFEFDCVIYFQSLSAFPFCYILTTSLICEGKHCINCGIEIATRALIPTKCSLNTCHLLAYSKHSFRVTLVNDCDVTHFYFRCTDHKRFKNCFASFSYMQTIFSTVIFR